MVHGKQQLFETRNKLRRICVQQNIWQLLKQGTAKIAWMFGKVYFL